MAIWLLAVSSVSHPLIYLWRPISRHNIKTDRHNYILQKAYTSLYKLSTARFKNQNAVWVFLY